MGGQPRDYVGNVPRHQGWECFCAPGNHTGPQRLVGHECELCRPFDQVPDGLDKFISPLETPHQSYVRMENATAVRKAAAGLPATYRQVLLLCYIEEFSAREVAAFLQSNISTVKTRLFRARRMLYRALQARRSR